MARDAQQRRPGSGMASHVRGILSVALSSAIAALCLTAPGAVASSAPPLSTLQPGGFRVIEHPLDVNVVFVGLQPGSGPQQVDVRRFLDGLPHEAMPHVRDPGFYGIQRDLGLHFTYRYHTEFAPKSFDDAFFSYLASHGTPGPPTLYQRLYNQQHAATRHISSNLMLDAVDTERWLGEHSSSIGVDTRQYTIFFIDWYGRPDFQDHLYDKPGDPDPNTGISDASNNYGPGDAWGGTTPDDPKRPLGSLRRIWFYDASAAVDGVDSSWNVDDPAPAGGDSMSYRMPPIWEYGNTNGYRPFDDLNGDLAKLARYVAIDELFTPSPIYDPALSGPKLPTHIEIDLTGLSGVPGQSATSLIQGSSVTSNLAPLEPYNRFSYEAKDRTLSGRELDVFKCYHSIFTASPASCYGNRLDPSGFGDLYLWMDDHLFSEFIDGDPDYEVPSALYYTPDALGTGRFLGNSNDDFKTGVQTYPMTWWSPDDPRQEKPVDFPVPGDLTFTPTDAQHFAVAQAPATFDPNTGADLQLGDDASAEVKLPFTFPFLGTRYPSIYVNSNGSVTLGTPDPKGITGYETDLLAGPPRIAALEHDLDPSRAGAVSASVRPGSVVVTWAHVPAYGVPGEETFQVTLDASGRITLAYRELTSPYGYVGVIQGSGGGPTTNVDFAHGLPTTLPAGSILEQFSPGDTLGPTSTLTHEVGHHLGLSHPHDGYDWESGVDFSPIGKFYFAWEGDYSDTVMSYVTQASGFSQFDRDALDRDMTSIFINESNAILGKIYASPRAGDAADLITAADQRAAQALRDLAAMDYRSAAATAHDAYQDVLAAAAKANVKVEPEAAQADYNSQGHSFALKDPLLDPRS